MMDEKLNFSYLFGSNAPYIEELYENFLENPNSVDEKWKQYFTDLSKQPGAADVDIAHAPIRESFANLAKTKSTAAIAGGMDEAMMKKQVGVLRLISAYRIQGVGAAQLDPLKRIPPRNIEALDPKFHGLNDADMAVQFNMGEGDFSGQSKLPLSQIISNLKQTYCGHLALEYIYIPNTEERRWLRNYFEDVLSTPSYSAEQKRRILKEMTAAETLERYLHTKYVGQKRFGVEGGESVIAGLNYLIQNAGKDGVEEVIIGMAHRGRLNVLVNILGKKPGDLFAEFEGRAEIKLPSGDVKYHMGFSSDIATPNGPMHVSLAFNPSHLEIVNPVVEGSARAKQKRLGENGRDKVLPVLIHGDSAFVGLGVNQATFNLSKTRGYTTGGTVHIVINNQIGFTTSDTRDTRSTVHCTDVAKMVSAPVIHVNGDDPERVCFAIQAALDYRKKFNKDIVIDVVCYRKWGHNEGDDPTLTQPMMYKKVSQHPGARALYTEQLIAEGVVTQAEADGYIQAYRDALDKGEHVEQTTLSNFQRTQIDWSKYQGKDWREDVETGLPAADIERLAEKFTAVPEGFALHPTAKRVLEARKGMAAGSQPIDWGMAETLAYASLVTKGHGVRISGEDSGRGTFSHRHAVLHDQKREKWDDGTYVPLRNMGEGAGEFLVIDSILNEEAVMAFEYGFACSAPDKLTIWEAQFGDFANGAQVLIDQFITSGETKWGRYSGLTMLLPHGYEGQGPEHSSARVERYLQLCAEDNVRVCVPTTPAQIFHLLRSQVLGTFRKPLIVMSPKSLLRHKLAVSDLQELAGGAFRPVIGEIDELLPDAQIRRVVLCSGKVYYDLLQKRRDENRRDIAIIRVEQLYPFPQKAVAAELARYPNADIVWCQEEPRNQGAWRQIYEALAPALPAGKALHYTGRVASASTAAGYLKLHNAEQAALVRDALGLTENQ